MDIKLPRLGEGADSGVVVNILVKEGDTVQVEQAIIELETEKAVGSIPSSAAGTVTKIYAKVGEKLSAGQNILALAEVDGAAVPATPATPAPVVPERSAPAAAGPARHIPGIPIAASPTVRRLAADVGIDLTRVVGTEPGGRITLADVRAYIQQLQAGAPAPAAAPAPAVVESIDFSQWGPVKKTPLTAIRRTISRRLHESWTHIPHVTQFDEADVTGLLELVKKHKPAYEAKGARLTMTPLVLKAVTATLQKHPIFNTSLDEATHELVTKEYYHLGVAVDTEQGLLVPVMRNVNQKSVLEVAKELEALAEKAKQRKLSGDEMKGGTFTISNQGGIGGAHFTPIVNRPEVAILGLGRGALKPVVREKTQIVPRTLLPLALSYDHRVIDGGQAARFIVDLVQALEQFPENQIQL